MNRRSFLGLLGGSVAALATTKYFFAPAGGWPTMPQFDNATYWRMVANMPNHPDDLFGGGTFFAGESASDGGFYPIRGGKIRKVWLTANRREEMIREWEKSNAELSAYVTQRGLIIKKVHAEPAPMPEPAYRPRNDHILITPTTWAHKDDVLRRKGEWDPICVKDIEEFLSSVSSA